MTPRNYRRLTRGLFCFLFLIFFLLYLLLRQGMEPGPNGGWGGLLYSDLGTVVLSDIRSGGFIIDEFHISAPSHIGAEAFNENVGLCHAELYNEGEATIRVSANIHGTDLKNGKSNAGLCAGFYYYTGETDPVGSDYQAFLTQPASAFDITPFLGNGLTLYTKTDQYPLELIIEPGQTIYLNLFFWVDDTVMPTLTELQRESLSVTVKLTSRAVS